ncbi:TIR domain-containing protein [Halarchaeum sp. P4]|uniref:toll/interleukin-1 receptor domain-containing protein n=1 Tax=Halarchaeum sp. P4 TaxID=3421639 RepID=UPI003EB9D9B1
MIMVKQVFVSHAEADLDDVKRVLSPIQNLLFDLTIAISEPEAGRIPATVMKQISNSDVFIPVLTHNSKDSQWVNQEIGYATSQRPTIIPLFEDDSMLKGLIGDYKGIKWDKYNSDRATFEVITMLRRNFEPLALGPLMPDWYLKLQCDYGTCNWENTFSIDRSQEELWKIYEENNIISWNCENCGTEYRFNPATFEFEGATEPG